MPRAVIFDVDGTLVGSVDLHAKTWQSAFLAFGHDIDFAVPYDAEAAAEVGLRTIGLLCGGFSETSLRKAGCGAIYNDPADLLAHHDQLPNAYDAVAP